MAQQDEPLYDFPEPTQSSAKKILGLQRGRGSLRSISVLDRLLLTVPVWLQLSINPATALHILQREPPGTFLVRKSRTSQKNVLCVRLQDDSIPSFVHQFGIVEEQCALCLETSAISFPDLPRLVAFYCVSRDVLPFPLELPDAIAKACSHKELESISHMGIEFWNSHLNVRGPRETPKSQKEAEKKPVNDDVTSTASTAAVPPVPSSGSIPPPGSEDQNTTEPDSDKITLKPTLFHEFCPITTRSPRELDCGSGLGAFCFINPLFLQSHNVLSRRRFLKRSLKVRVSTETSTLLSPPLAPPPPPPLMPKTKRKCKPQEQQEQDGNQSAAQESPTEAQAEDPSEEQIQLEEEEEEEEIPLPIIMEHLPDDADYMQPSAIINSSFPRSLSPYLSPAVALMAPPLSPKGTPPLSPARSPNAISPSLSPYQSPSLSPRLPISFSPLDSPSTSPYQSPSPSPKPPFSLSPINSSPLSQMAEQNYQIPTVLQKSEQECTGGEDNEKEEDEVEEQQEGNEEEMGNGAAAVDCRDESCEDIEKEVEDKEIGQTEKEEMEEKEEQGLVLQMKDVALNDTGCSSSHELGEAAEIVPSPSQQNTK